MYEINLYELKNEENTELEIQRFDNTETYEYFFTNFMIQNKPCIITNIPNSWSAYKYWVKDNQPNVTYLLENYKNHEVCVSDCNERYFNAQKTQTFTFKNYLKYYCDYVDSHYNNKYPLLYLKDWHLKKNSEIDFYTVPIFFASDWLNEYFSEKTDDDYMFVYMGPKGTWTPFHVDVFTSFSWSTNICGKKKWIFFPPSEEIPLKDHLGNLPYDVTEHKNKGKYIEIIQNIGDAIFVPSGWHHQVWNLENTISINHNWINGCNIKNMWISIVENLNAVKKEISDCKDMENWIDHCQIVLKASHGIDFFTFYDFLHFIATNRLNVLKFDKNEKQFTGWKIGKNHAKFDLIKLSEVLELFIRHEDFNNFNFVKDSSKIKPNDLLITIKEFLLK